MPRRLTAPPLDLYAGPLLSGLLLALCFPKPDLGWLAWFALVPLLLTRPTFKGYFAGGLLFFLLLLYWIYPTCRAGQVVPPVAALATFALAAFLALIFGLFGTGLARLDKGARHPFLYPIMCGTLWVTLEMVREHVMGFPWELLGYSQWRYPLVTQVASVTGVHGLSFLIVWANAAIAFAITRRQPLGLLAPVLALAAVFGFGKLRALPDTGPALRVAILQGNIDQYKKWDSAFVAEIEAAYAGLAADVRDVDLVVWPESALPGWLDEQPVLEWLGPLVRRSKVPHVIGTVTHGHSGGVLNAAVLMRPDGTYTRPYSKRHLVPFGEYVPLQSFFGKWAPILNELGGVTAGVDPTPLDHPKARLGASVCYEVVFPAEVLETVRAGAQVLVNVTNDGWYLDTAAPYQHLAMSSLRAVENGRPLIRAANTGVSAVFDRFGRLQSWLPLGKRDILYAEVLPESEQTPFTVLGEAFAWLCVAATLFFLVRKR